MNQLEKANRRTRESCHRARAYEWQGSLSLEEFVERNRTLYAHPYAKKIETFVLRNESDLIVSCMDSLSVPYRMLVGKKIVKGTANHLASVVTPKEFRKAGYASDMLSQFYARKKGQIGVLFSDIGPKFYGQWNFKPIRVFQYEVPASKLKRVGKNSELASLSFKDFMNEFRGRRERILRENGKSGAFVLDQDQKLWDWHLERYGYFHKIRGTEMDNKLFWITNSDVVAAIPNPVTQTLDCLWTSSHSPKALDLLSRLATWQRLPRVRFWSAKNIPAWKPEREWAMIQHLPGKTKPIWLDCQFIDWW